MPTERAAEPEEMPHEPPAAWSEWSECQDNEADAEHATADTAPFVELLVRVRTQLRAAKQWALADEIRQRLAELGIILEDGREETTWRRA
jgi:cysteinyl-tRNA synthetase